MSDKKSQNSLPKKSIKIQEKRKKLRDKQKALESAFLCELGRLMQQIVSSLTPDVLKQMKAIYEKHEVGFNEKE